MFCHSTLDMHLTIPLICENIVIVYQKITKHLCILKILSTKSKEVC